MRGKNCEVCKFREWNIGSWSPCPEHSKPEEPIDSPTEEKGDKE